MHKITLTNKIKLILFVICSVATTGCRPDLGFIVGSDEITAKELNQRLSGANKPVIIDIRNREAFAKGHIPDAIHVRLRDLERFLDTFRPSNEQDIVLVCYRGNSSAIAEAKVYSYGYRKAYSLRGGMAEWGRNGFALSKTFLTSNKAKESPTQRLVPLGFFEQLISTSAGLVLKPIHMLLSLLLLFYLNNRPSRPLALIRRGILIFLIGESICAYNYLFANGSSVILDALHNLGMVGLGAFTTLGIFNLLDDKVLNWKQPQRKCAFIGLCSGCWKHKPYTCIFHRMVKLLSLIMVPVSLIPYCVRLQPYHQISQVFYSRVTFSYPVELLLIDFRLYPLLAAMAFLLAFILLNRGVKNIEKAKSFFVTGIGFFAFSFFRFFLLNAFSSKPFWFDFWEELTELVFVVSLALFLYWSHLPGKVDRGTRIPQTAF